jgi:hypothetical protein
MHIPKKSGYLPREFVEDLVVIESHYHLNVRGYYLADVWGGGDEVEPHSLKNFFNTSIEKNSQSKIGKSNALNGAHESSYTEVPSLITYACNHSMGYVKYDTIIVSHTKTLKDPSALVRTTNPEVGSIYCRTCHEDTAHHLMKFPFSGTSCSRNESTDR